MNLNEQIARIKQLLEQSEPESGKCGITRACEKQDAEFSRQNKEADKESARLIKQDEKYYSQQRKFNLNMDYDMDNEKRDRANRDLVRKEYEKYKNNSLLQGGSFSPDQKFSVLYKVLDSLRLRPQLSYAKRLQSKFGFPNPKSVTLDQLIGYARQMGWDNFIRWYESGGPEIKKIESQEGAGAYDAPAFQMEPDHTTFKHQYKDKNF